MPVRDVASVVRVEQLSAGQAPPLAAERNPPHPVKQLSKGSGVANQFANFLGHDERTKIGSGDCGGETVR